MSDVVRITPAAEHAPRIALHWSAESTTADRDAVLARYGLTADGSDGPLLQHVRLSEGALGSLAALVNEPAVAGADGLDQSTATIPESHWSRWERWRFGHAWLRLRVLGGMEGYARAGEAVAALFFALPVLAAMTTIPLRRYLARPVSARALIAFAAFGLVATAGLLRRPYEIRAVDGVALPAILLGMSAAVLCTAALRQPHARARLLAAAAVVLALVLLKGVSMSGQLADRLDWVSADAGLRSRLRGRLSAMSSRLLTSPPLGAHAGQAAPVPLRLAAYVVACVPARERLLVLWFAPEIYYYAGRAMAQRHLVYIPGWAALQHEQRLTLQKVQQSSPSIALASSSLDGLTTTVYPEVVAYVHAHYDQAASLADDDREYMILARRDRPIVRRFGDEGWPCYQ